LPTIRQLDPLSPIIASDRGAILYYARQYDRAIEQLRAVLDMDPHFPRAGLAQSAYLEKGMYAESMAELNRWPHEGPWYWARVAAHYGRSGQPEEAEAALQKMRQLERQQAVDPLTYAMAYIGMNKEEEAFAYLWKAYEGHSTSLTALKVDPLFDPLRGDPRFQTILRGVGLAP